MGATRGFTVFFTGLPAAGKSTLASCLLATLEARGYRDVTLLDGDAARRDLSSDLGFSRNDRDLNVSRIAGVAAGKTARGGLVLCAVIAPYDAARKEARRIVTDAGGFVLVHVSTPLDVCERRDPKGLYARARAGALPHFTGVSDPYEPPDDAELVVDTSGETADGAADRIVAYLERTGYLSPSRRSIRDLWLAWRRLARAEQRASVAAAFMIPVMAVSLRLSRLEAILRRVERGARRADGADLEAVRQLVRAVARAENRGPYAGNCLSRSLTLFWLLRRRGISARLQLGARLRDGRLEAHAWVERDGLILNDRRDVRQRFAPFVPAAHTPEDVLASWPGDAR